MNRPVAYFQTQKDRDPYSPVISGANRTRITGPFDSSMTLVRGRKKVPDQMERILPLLRGLRRASIKGDLNWLQPEPDDLSPVLQKLNDRLKNVNVTKAGSIWSKLQATFYGRVDSMVGDVAIVSLINKKTGDSIEADCPIDTLLKEGIGEEDEFICEVWKDLSTTSVRFSRLKPNKLPPERIAAILKEVDNLDL